jgi:hypothetical protein
MHSSLWQAMMSGQLQVFPAEEGRDIPFLQMSQRAVAVQMMQKKGAWGEECVELVVFDVAQWCRFRVG